MAVITISRQYGSGGEEITSRVCQLLGYHRFNKCMVEEAARAAGFAAGEAIDYNEENHKVRSFMERLFTSPSYTLQASIWPENLAAMRTIEETRLREEDVLTLVRKAVWSAYETGDVVIVGRGGQMILQNCPQALHVRLVAPLEERIKRVKESIQQSTHRYENELDLRRSAQEQIHQRDAASADYIKRFYNADWDNPHLYHVVLNTAKLGLPNTVQTITRMAENL